MNRLIYSNSAVIYLKTKHNFNAGGAIAPPPKIVQHVHLAIDVNITLCIIV